MKRKISIVFFLLTFVFVLLISTFFIPQVRGVLQGAPFLFLFALIFLFGLLLLIFSLKFQKKGRLKKFLILTGISPLVMVGGSVLHNFVYGIFIFFFGSDFWDKIGTGDEPFFFFIAVVIAPLGFLTGLIGTLVILVKNRLKKQRE